MIFPLNLCFGEVSKLCFKPGEYVPGLLFENILLETNLL